MNRSREKGVLYCTGQQVQNDAVDAVDFVVVEENYILNVNFGNSEAPYILFYCLFQRQCYSLVPIILRNLFAF